MVLALQIYEDRDCGTCTESKKRSWGCEDDIAPFSFDGEKITRCPKRPLLDEPELYSDIFYYYQLYKEGHLPESINLGFLGQTNCFVQATRVIDAALADVRDEKKRREEAKQSAKARGLALAKKGA